MVHLVGGREVGKLSDLRGESGLSVVLSVTDLRKCEIKQQIL